MQRNVDNERNTIGGNVVLRLRTEKKDHMSPSTRPNDIKPTPEHRQTSKPMLLGKPIPSMLVRGRRSNSDASIWVLAICIAIALILGTTRDAE